jgi:hypothetical protein
MFGSFLPSLWSSSKQSLLGSREPTLLCNQVETKTYSVQLARPRSIASLSNRTRLGNTEDNYVVFIMPIQ